MNQHEAPNAGSQEGKHFGAGGETARNLDFGVYTLLDTFASGGYTRATSGRELAIHSRRYYSPRVSL
jgi:hypothetical protein